MHCRWIILLASLAFSTGCSTSRPLFNGKNLEGWTELGSKGSWSAQDGILKCNGKKEAYAWLSTNEKYGNFILTFDVRIWKNGNTGVFLRAPDREGRTSMKGCEVQIRDDAADKDLKDATGAVFSRIPASGRYSKPLGEWNSFAIKFHMRRLRIEVNGSLVSDTDIDTIESIRVIPNEGYIGLQNHDHPADFRNIRIVEIKE